jgi:hypothetical protein
LLFASTISQVYEGVLESFIHCVTTAGFSSGPSSCVDLLQYLA